MKIQFDSLDHNGDGKLTKEEFIQFNQLGDKEELSYLVTIKKINTSIVFDPPGTFSNYPRLTC